MRTFFHACLLAAAPAAADNLILRNEKPPEFRRPCICWC
jgi:hypothetical protein